MNIRRRLCAFLRWVPRTQPPPKRRRNSSSESFGCVDAVSNPPSRRPSAASRVDPSAQPSFAEHPGVRGGAGTQPRSAGNATDVVRLVATPMYLEAFILFASTPYDPDD